MWRTSVTGAGVKRGWAELSFASSNAGGDELTFVRPMVWPASLVDLVALEERDCKHLRVLGLFPRWRWALFGAGGRHDGCGSWRFLGGRNAGPGWMVKEMTTGCQGSERQLRQPRQDRAGVGYEPEGVQDGARRHAILRMGWWLGSWERARSSRRRKTWAKLTAEPPPAMLPPLAAPVLPSLTFSGLGKISIAPAEG